MQRRQYRTIVIGLGALGSAAVWALARRTAGDVLGLEHVELARDFVGAHDHSRIISPIAEETRTAALAQAAYRAWGRLEAENDLRLLYRVGGLDLFPEGSAHTCQAQLLSLKQAGIAFELMDGAAAMRRWAPFRLDESTCVLHQPESAMISALAAISALQRSARRHGARVVERTSIYRVQAQDGEFGVTTSDGRFMAEQVILAPGALTNTLLRSFGFHLPLRVFYQQGVYFAAEHLSQYMPGRFPAWRWRDEPAFAGTPVHGAPGVKVGQEGAGPDLTQGLRPFEPDLGVQHRVGRLVQRLLPHLGPQLFCRPCLTTQTPDRAPLVDRIPGQSNAWLAVEGAYGFEFAPALGEALADLITGRTPDVDLSPYRIDRMTVRELQPVPRSPTP